MKKITIEEAKEINGGVTTKMHATYWSAFCGYCGSEWVSFGLWPSSKASAILKARKCEIYDASTWAIYA